MTSQKEVSALLDSARLESTRTQPFYCDDDIFALDMQEVVSRKWLLIDHATRIPEPGQFFLYEVGQESIIVIRDDHMEINASVLMFSYGAKSRSGRPPGMVCLWRQEKKRNRLTSCIISGMGNGRKTEHQGLIRSD